MSTNKTQVRRRVPANHWIIGVQTSAFQIILSLGNFAKQERRCHEHSTAVVEIGIASYSNAEKSFAINTPQKGAILHPNPSLTSNLKYAEKFIIRAVFERKTKQLSLMRIKPWQWLLQSILEGASFPPGRNAGALGLNFRLTDAAL